MLSGRTRSHHVRIYIQFPSSSLPTDGSGCLNNERCLVRVALGGLFRRRLLGCGATGANVKQRVGISFPVPPTSPFSVFDGMNRWCEKVPWAYFQLTCRVRGVNPEGSRFNPTISVSGGHQRHGSLFIHRLTRFHSVTSTHQSLLTSAKPSGRPSPHRTIKHPITSRSQLLIPNQELTYSIVKG